MRSDLEPMTHEDLVVLTSWMVDRGHSARTVADAVEKPWKWTRELAVATAALEHEHANPCGDASVYYGSSDLHAYCGGTKDCDWEIDLSREDLTC